MTYYHATPRENVFDIIRDGLKTGADGFIYLCETPMECLEFFKWRAAPRLELAVIPIELDPATVSESFDHNSKFIKARAFTVDYDIPRELIPMLDKIQVYELIRTSEK